MFDWNQYLFLAEKLFYLKKTQEFYGLGEACLRSAISRAYYVVFCMARNYLRDEKRVEIPLRDTHKFVHMRYVNSTIKEEKRLGEYLKELWEKRKKADYDDSPSIREGETMFCLKTAKDALSLIKDFNK